MNVGKIQIQVRDKTWKRMMRMKINSKQTFDEIITELLDDYKRRKTGE